MILGATCVAELPPLSAASADALIAAVAEDFGICAKDMLARNRLRWLVWPRHALALALRARPTLGGMQRSLPEIARFIGGRDHSTICNSIAQCFAVARRQPGYAEVVEGLLLADLAEPRPVRKRPAGPWLAVVRDPSPAPAPKLRWCHACEEMFTAPPCVPHGCAAAQQEGIAA